MTEQCVWVQIAIQAQCNGKIIPNFNSTASNHALPIHTIFLPPNSLGSLRKGVPAAKLVYHHVHPWKNNPGAGNEGGHSKVIAKDYYPMDLKARFAYDWADIQTMIDSAHMHARFSQLRNISVQILPNPECEIRTMVGPMASAHLDAGQVLPILVQVRVPAEASATKTSTKNMLKDHEHIDPFAKSDQLMKNLEEFLGVTEMGLFTVQVRYEHSLFPANSEIFMRKECRVRRSVGGSDWSLPLALSANSFNVINSEACTERMSLSSICKDYPYIASWDSDDEMAEERTVRVTRASVDDELEVSPDVTSIELAARRDQNHDSELGQCRVTKADSSSILGGEVGSDSEASKQELWCASSIRLSSESPNSTQIQSSPDRARKIWRYMRRESRSKRENQSSCDSLDRSGTDDGDLSHIKSTAIKNKRSLGASTLRSLRQEFQRSVG